MKTTSDAIAEFFAKTGSTIKGLAKLLLSTRRSTVKAEAAPGEKLIIMGNGPSLADTIATQEKALHDNPTMAVNFAANTEEFFRLRPRYYILADPHFFESDHENVVRLRENLGRVDWPMTLLLPAKARLTFDNPSGTVNIVRYNPVGIEGFEWFENMVYDSGRGMPRPRNVLIPAIMTGMALGYKTIVIAGADHSWTSTLSVNESNEVVSVQPHFYKEAESERKRVESVYRDVRLHEIIYSFYVAFKAYHDIARYARSRGVKILNATPGSFIDAFERVGEI